MGLQELRTTEPLALVTLFSLVAAAVHTPTGGVGGFLGDSVSKETACNVGDLGSVPGLGRSLEEGMATHSSILAWRIFMYRGAW